MRVFLTGATGFVGGAVLRALVRAGREVRVLVRPDADRYNIRDMPVEIYHGDVRDRDTVRRAVAGCQQVYHVAALYKLWVRRKAEMYACNVTGTENILAAAREHNVEKVIYTSSVAALGIPNDGTPGTEQTPVALSNMVGHYKRSKFLAEQVALRYAQEGLPVVIVNPSTPVGAADVRPTPSGKMIVDFLDGKMRGFVDTGLNIVDVDDVATGHLLAAEKGRIGEKYILGNANLTLLQILTILSELTDIPAPRFRVPYMLALSVAYADAALARLWPWREPFVPPVGVKLSKKRMFFEATKAVRDLGLPQTPAREALRKAVVWFAENGYVKGL
jgi:dihydroflavonol-4-reductase